MPDWHDHTAFENAVFLPMSPVVLERNQSHLAALGMALHLRHIKSARRYARVA